MVGSYESTNWPCTNCILRDDLPKKIKTVKILIFYVAWCLHRFSRYCSKFAKFRIFIWPFGKFQAQHLVDLVNDSSDRSDWAKKSDKISLCLDNIFRFTKIIKRIEQAPNIKHYSQLQWQCIYKEKTNNKHNYKSIQTKYKMCAYRSDSLFHSFIHAFGWNSAEWPLFALDLRKIEACKCVTVQCLFVFYRLVNCFVLLLFAKNQQKPL